MLPSKSKNAYYKHFNIQHVHRQPPPSQKYPPKLVKKLGITHGFFPQQYLTHVILILIVNIKFTYCNNCIQIVNLNKGLPSIHSDVHRTRMQKLSQKV